MPTVGGRQTGSVVTVSVSFNTSAPTSSVPQGKGEVTQGVQKTEQTVNLKVQLITGCLSCCI